MRVLTIAGSDPIAGAGIQADLKTFHAFDVYCASVITSITIQNTVGVTERIDLPSEDVQKQIEIILSDITIDAVKIGMLPKKETSVIVKKYIKDFEYVVFDPIVISKNGYRMMDADTIDYIKSKFIKDLFLITPNTTEAEILTDEKISSEEDMKKACRILYEKGAKNVLITGGDLNQMDMLYDGKNFFKYGSKKIKKTVHGTGCAFSSAIAANLAKGKGLNKSVEIAKRYITESIQHSIRIGNGYRVIDHFYNLKKESERHYAIQELKEAYSVLEKENIYELIPEVRSNLVFALKNADSPGDIAGFPGRIMKINKKIGTIGPPEFGVSKHMANLILKVMEYNGEMRSVMNIKYSKRIIDICKQLNYHVFFIDRKKEPKLIKKKEGKSLKWEIEEVFKKTGRVPDILYDMGDIGKEPMIRVFGKTPKDVIGKVIQLKRNKKG